MSTYDIDSLLIEPHEGEKSETHMNIKVRSALLGGDFSIMEGVMAPKSLLPPHTHQHEDQVVYVIDGELVFEIGGEGGDIFTAKAGSYVVKPRGISHGFWNALDVPVRYIELSGKDGFERFVDGRSEMGLVQHTLQAEERYGMKMHSLRIPKMLIQHRLERVSSIEFPWDKHA